MNEIDLLILDDEENILNYLRRLFHDEPFSVTTVSDPEQAMNMVKDGKVRAVLFDQGLPGLQGVDLLGKIAQVSPQTVRLLFTGDTQAPEVRQAMKDGKIYRAVAKPCDDMELKMAVNQALEKFSLEEQNRNLQERASPPPAEPDLRNALKNKTILIVDDESKISELIRARLEERGAGVVIAENGVIALNKLKAIHPHLIILDINMPEMNGLDFYRRILSAHGRSLYPVLVLTTREELGPTFQDIDAAGFMPKPFAVERLEKEAARILSSDIDPVIFHYVPRKDLHAEKIQWALGGERYKVITVEDLNLMRANAILRIPAAVLVPLEGKEGTGPETICGIREISQLREVPVLAYSFTGFKEYREMALSAGADRFLLNPADYHAFVTAVREMEIERKKKTVKRDGI